MNDKVDKIFSVNIDEINDINFKTNEKFCLIVDYENYKYEFLINLISFEKETVIFNPNSKIQKSFLDESNLYEDNFLFENLAYNIIYYLDPTKKDFDGLNPAFGIGTEKTWHLRNIAEIIKVISENIYDYSMGLKYNNIFFYGRDNYAVMSMILSTLIKNSSAIVENPYFNLELSSYWTNLKDTYLKKISEDKFNQMKNRFNVIDLINTEKYIPNSYISFNSSDKNYFNSQVAYFLEKFNNLSTNYNKNSNKFNLSFNADNNKIYNKYDSLNFINESIKIQVKKNLSNTIPLLMVDEFKTKLDINYDKLLNENISQEEFLDFVTSYFESWAECRIDLKNFGNETNRIEILEKDDLSSVVFPRWFKNNQGEGCNIVSSENIRLKIKCINDGNLRINFLGSDYRYFGKNRIPIYMTYKKFKINDEVIFSKDVLVSHDDSYVYTRKCKNNEIMDIEIDFETLYTIYPYIKQLIIYMNDNEDIKESYDMLNDYVSYLNMLNNSNHI